MSSSSSIVLVLVLLLLVYAFIALVEAALMWSRDARLQQMAEEGDEKAELALKLAQSPRFLARLRVSLVALAVLAGGLAEATQALKVAAWLERFDWIVGYQRAVASVLVFGAVTFVVAVLGELVPRAVATANPERTARVLAGTMWRISRPLAPFIVVVHLASERLVRLFGVKGPPPKEAAVTDEELGILIEQAVTAGTFNKVEQQMVEGVLGLDQLPVTAMMTPRPKLVFLNLDDPDDVNWRKIVTSGHSHFPVYQHTRDQVVGMVAVKSLWAQTALGVQTPLKNLLVPPLLVPETTTAIQLLEAFKKSGKHTALVTDEFGSVQGMLTMIDVLEAIVGDLPEQGRKSENAPRQREDGSWVVEGSLNLDDLKTLLHVDELPHEEEGGFQTLAGLIFTHLGRVPRAGDAFEWSGWRFEVVVMERNRIDKVLVATVAKPVKPAKAGSTGG